MYEVELGFQGLVDRIDDLTERSQELLICRRFGREGLLESTEQTIYNWWNRHLVDAGPQAGTPTIENRELLAARRRIAELEKYFAASRVLKIAV